MREAGHVQVVSEAASEEDGLRARFYALLARLLARPPTPDDLQALARLEGDGSEIGRALATLAQTAGQISPADAEEEFSALFIGLTEGELRPYKSFYLTGFLYEKPLADVRRDMEALGVARAEGVPEPEDHIAALCETMHGLITGIFPLRGDFCSQSLHLQKTFFGSHLQTWAPRFFRDLEAARNARLYRPIGTVGRVFMAIEGEAFTMVD